MKGYIPRSEQRVFVCFGRAVLFGLFSSRRLNIVGFFGDFMASWEDKGQDLLALFRVSFDFFVHA